MYQYFVSNPVIAIIFILIVAAVFIFLLVKKLQSMGMEKIRAVVYKASIKQKFEYVVNLARSHLPAPFNIFVTESLLRSVVQMWFDLVKDLLDDGRVNGTTQEDK